MNNLKQRQPNHNIPTSMKTLRHFFGLFVTCLSLSALGGKAAAAQSSTLIVGLSPHLTSQERNSSAEGVLGLVLTPGWTGRIEVFDALRSRPVASFDTSKMGNLNAAARARLEASSIIALRGFLAQETNVTTGDIQMPEFVEHVATHVRRGSEPLTILLVGSALYHCKEKGFWMDDSMVPSQDHLLASAKASPFGTLEKSNHLAGTVVHFIYREGDFTSTFHRKAVDDILKGFLSLQNGRIVSSSWDFKTTFERVSRGVDAPSEIAKLTPIGRLCMLKVVGDQLIPVEDSTPGVPASGVDDLKKQIAALQGQLSQTKGQTTAQAELTARLNKAAGKLAQLEGQVAKAGAERAVLADQLDQATHDRARAEVQARHDALLAAGDQEEALITKRSLFEQALAVAVANTLDKTVVEGRLKTVREKLAPAQLPAGAVTDLIRVSTENYPPCLGLDLAVENADGKPVLGLADKDFSVLLNGQKVAVKTATLPATGVALPPLNLVIAIDCSGSIKNALNQAKAATTEMLATLRDRPNVRVKVIGFSKKVEPVADWTDDLNAVTPAMARLKASGSTALYQAIADATTALKNQQGDRRLVVLTDGGDTEGSKQSPTSLAETMRNAGIVPYFIGLKTEELDTVTLGKMATQSGGFFRMAGDAADLRNVFGDAGRRLTRQAYRLVVTPREFPQNESAALAVFVGNGPNTVRMQKSISLPVINPSAEMSAR